MLRIFVKWEKINSVCGCSPKIAGSCFVSLAEFLLTLCFMNLWFPVKVENYVIKLLLGFKERRFK
jgi:hypothetical protein